MDTLTFLQFAWKLIFNITLLEQDKRLESQIAVLLQVMLTLIGITYRHLKDNGAVNLFYEPWQVSKE